MYSTLLLIVVQEHVVPSTYRHQQMYQQRGVQDFGHLQKRRICTSQNYMHCGLPRLLRHIRTEQALTC